MDVGAVGRREGAVEVDVLSLGVVEQDPAAAPPVPPLRRSSSHTREGSAKHGRGRRPEEARGRGRAQPRHEQHEKDL